jgi:hypothetical protein
MTNFSKKEQASLSEACSFFRLAIACPVDRGGYESLYQESTELRHHDLSKTL